VTIHTSQLDEYKDTVNLARGDVNHPTVTTKYTNFAVAFDTPVDQTLSPFSSAYFDQQIQLYEEISGRKLNQVDGELHLANPEELIASVNPLGATDVNHMSEYCRAILTMLSLADLPADAKVLDMGAGHGVSSELFAFAGCKVHAVDIDPVLGDVSRTRAERRNYPITRSNLNFDDVGLIEADDYSAAFFYQSLHHCLKPWELIGNLQSKLRPDGVIAFAGEPIQTAWWNNWGLRLDPESVYVAREYGWFESGWSHQFISECFAKNGMQLHFFTGGLSGTEIGIATAHEGKIEGVRERARKIGLSEIREPYGIGNERYLSLIGSRGEIMDRQGFVQQSGADGMLMYGPYAQFAAGRYEVVVYVNYAAGRGWNDRMKLDVASNGGNTVHWEKQITPNGKGDSEVVTFELEFAEPVDRVEIRAHVKGDRGWSVTVPVIRKIG
jgi:2-polyprenyl-3-methyl-5-hydroxy-6-metoxy-1,4-benzoquinol methylase